MKKNKKVMSTILGNTAIFIAVLLFVAAFKGIFGDENTAIGVSTIVLSLSLLSRDLTKKPFKNFAFLLAFDAITIFGAYIFESHLWFGLIMNFSIMCLIGYLFTYDVKNPINMLLGLQYVLLIGSPITAVQMPKRFMAGIASACIIIALQLLANRNKLAKSSTKILLLIEENILNKINLIKENKSTDKIDTSIDNLISNFKLTIFESGQINFKMNAYGNISVDLLSCIEKINQLLNELKGRKISEEIFDDIYEQFNNVKNGEFNNSDIDGIITKYNSEVVIVNEFLNAFEILQNKIKDFREVLDSKEKDPIKEVNIPQDFKMSNRHIVNVKNMSYRLAYGIRVGLLFALTGFVTKLFDLEFGKWMMFTVFALTQPYAEFSLAKSKKRVFGTAIGAIILLIAFSIIKESSGRMMVLLLAGYLLSYVNDYKYKAILITICATCVDAVSHINPVYVIMSRVVFVAIGVIISLLANKFLLRREYKHAEASLINIQKGSSERMMSEVMMCNDINENSIRNLFLLPALIENRVEVLSLNIEKSFINMSKSVVNDIYQLYLAGSEKYTSIFDDINSIVNRKNDLKEIEIELKEYAKCKEDIREQALVMSTIKVMYDFNRFNEEADKINSLSFA